MSRKDRKAIKIPDEIKREVEYIVERFNRANSEKRDYYYEAQFRGTHCYLNRCDYGSSNPICRLTYTGDMKHWDFAIFKWSSETYDPNEWMFPGDELVDGTIEGAMKAGLKAYPV